jgi:hypothetical protein
MAESTEAGLWYVVFTSNQAWGRGLTMKQARAAARGAGGSLERHVVYQVWSSTPPDVGGLGDIMYTPIAERGAPVEVARRGKR